MHNGPLADTLGNLVHRGTNLAKNSGTPDVTLTAGLAAGFAQLTTPDARPIDVATLVAQTDAL